MGDALTVILSVFSIASLLGAASGIFYGVRQNTIIATLKESNTAYVERNGQLDEKVAGLERRVEEQNVKINMLIGMKTPDFIELKRFITKENKRLIEEAKK